MPRQHLVVSVVAGLALLTGCGATTGASTPLVEPAAAVQEQPSQPVSVNAAGVAGLGTVLTDQGGKTLYLFTEDSKDPSRSTCVGECAKAWPPLMANSLADVQVSGVDPALIGTVERPEGGLQQVTVGGWPVYTYAKDNGPGKATGQGAQGVWFAITPEGKRAGAPDLALTATDIPGFGSALTDQEGRTLYLFTKDSTDPPKSTCDGQCAKTWPPMLSTGEEPVLTGVDPKLVGTVTRSDGSEQVTVGGWPVYTYVEGTAPGQTNGHGVSGVWFVIEELGCKSTAPVTTDEPQAEEEEQEEDTGY